MTGPSEFMSEATKVAQSNYVCAPTPFQYASLKAINYNMSEQIEEYKHKRDYIYEKLKDKYEVVKPSGAFYFFIKYTYDYQMFIEMCLKNKLLIVPGNAFSDSNKHFRISFSQDDKTIKKAIKVLLDIVEE